jgi:L-fuconolactonase
MRIDAHQHFWNYEPVKHGWINNNMSVLKRDFLPQHIAGLLQDNNIDGCVSIQADQSENETMFLLGLAEQYSFIKGVVGWIDLQSQDVEERLEKFSGYQGLKGFRHILQDEDNRSLMLTTAFKKGISCLNKYDYTFDLLVYPDQLTYTLELVKLFPGQKFVLDHLGKPSIKSGEIESWRKEIIALAELPNIHCKISGFVTEADWGNWNKDDFYPYFDVILKAFDIDRLLFGSDWPVCLLAAQYQEVYSIAEDYFASCSNEEKEKLFGNNAVAFYNL